MPGSEDRWRPGRIACFLALGLALYAGLFAWSDAVLRAHGERNPFHRIALAPERVDWLVLGASHALPLGFDDMPETIRAATGAEVLNLGMTGAGPFVLRLIGERFFEDHTAAGVLIVLDGFGFADRRWNAPRLDDSDVLPKMPADRRTAAVLVRALGWGLRWQSLLAHVSGFSRINDRTRFEPDRWEAEAKFDSAPRPSEAADRARIAFLYPGPPAPEVLMSGLDDLEALLRLTAARDARAVILRPPLPERFRTRLPEIEGFETGLAELAGRLGVPVIDHSAAIPQSRYYFDTDHLNRAGVLLWLESGLAAVLAQEAGSGGQ